ncbi:MAG: prepilin peptidase [Candidatus Kuenenia sp.]|nr:prepilin peptidase [Candidatus Kuenenia hertensis]
MGLVVGSFLNVCIYRIPKNKSLIWPHSFCPHCKESIRWFDNIPVISYIFLLGRCRTCKNKLSRRYPLVELLTGCIFLQLYYIFIVYRTESFCVFLGYLVLCCTLIISTFIDLELRIIPNEITFIGIPLFIIFSVVCPDMHHARGTLRSFTLIGMHHRLDAFIVSLIGTFTGGGLIYLCGIIGKVLFKKDAMGFGDVKLMGMIGAVVGWKLAVAVFFVAPFFGLLMAIPVLLFKKSHLIPYGPFLSAAALVCICFQDYFIGQINLYILVFSVLFDGFPS